MERILYFGIAFSVIFLIFSFGLTFISVKLGVIQMGIPHPDLPFKLEPSLNLARNIIVPSTFIVILDCYFSRKNYKQVTNIFVIFVFIIIIDL